jgi:hypothetical protein
VALKKQTKGDTKMTKTATIKMEKAITKIAVDRLEIETLERRGSDSLDFHDVSVWALKEMLEKAYKAGMEAAQK